MKKSVMAFLAAASFVTANPASAAPVVGQISFTGGAVAVGSPSFGSATGIDFVSGSSASPGTAGTITSYGFPTGTATGSFAGLQCITGTCGSIKDILSLASAGPINSFLILTGGPAISFDLSSVTYATNPTLDTLSLSAAGFINFAGLDRTPGRILLTAQGDNIVTFSATSLASVPTVPEPATWAMMIAGIGAIGFALRAAARRSEEKFNAKIKRISEGGVA